jgi:hypothetical protein
MFRNTKRRFKYIKRRHRRQKNFSACMSHPGNRV